MEAGNCEAVQHEVHAANAQHRHPGITIVARERLALRELPLLRLQLAAGETMRPALVIIGEIALVGVRLKQVLPRVDEKAASACGGIDYPLARPWIDHLHHHADDVPWRAKLAIRARSVELAE